MADDVKLYNIHQGLTGRDGGPYLDQIERIEAEKRRAVVEGREPADLTKPDELPATAGTPLVTGAQLVFNANPASNPSMQSTDPVADAIGLAAAKDDYPVSVHSERADISSKADDYDAAANPTVGSRDPQDVDRENQAKAKADDKPVAKPVVADKK